MSRPLIKALSWVLLATSMVSAPADADITVFAAASLTNVLSDLGKQFENKHEMPVKLSFAASSALAKQIEQGAPADLFISADTQWMDYLDGKGKIDHASRTDLLGNTLVLIAPRGEGFSVAMEKNFDFAHSFEGKLCTGVVESVPAGIYAKEALSSLGWWDGIRGRVVGNANVRAALNLVERGECAAGIVYETDAKQSRKIEIVGRFPGKSHAPIVYPAALVSESEEAGAFLEYLRQGAAAKVFAQYGFRVLGH